MTCGDSSYYPMNYYPGFDQTSMMRAVAHNNLPASQRICLWTLVRCPSGIQSGLVAVPTIRGRRDGRIIYRKYPTLQQR